MNRNAKIQPLIDFTEYLMDLGQFGEAIRRIQREWGHYFF
jgi:hypothetical protein